MFLRYNQVYLNMLRYKYKYGCFSCTGNILHCAFASFGAFGFYFTCVIQVELYCSYTPQHLTTRVKS